MITVVLLGALLGGGAFLCWVAVSSPAPALHRALGRLERDGSPVAGPLAGSSSEGAVPARLLDGLVRVRLGEITADLAVCHRVEQRHALEKLATAVSLSVVVVLLATALAVVGAPLPLPAVLLLVPGAAAIGLIVPDLTVRSQAAARRDAFRHALSSYLDLVNVLLAGGAGMETSLVAAAEAGDGWVFEHLREELERSRAVRRSPWECFHELGERLGVQELVELAATVQLAGQHGARVKGSLAARAAAMRAHQLARLEAAAQSATERMGLPTVLMFVGFVALLGYPALQMIVGGL